jgi:hypothetical protein
MTDQGTVMNNPPDMKKRGSVSTDQGTVMNNPPDMKGGENSRRNLLDRIIFSRLVVSMDVAEMMII